MVATAAATVNQRPTSGVLYVAHGARLHASSADPGLLHSWLTQPPGRQQEEIPMFTLYTYFRSSAAFRVRIALNLKALAWQPEVVWLPSGEQAADQYRDLNPQALVPTLVADGQRLAQSMAIIEYLDEVHPQPPLLPGTPLDRARIRSLAQLVACDIHPLNNLRILKYLKHEMGQQQDAIDRWYRHWCIQGLAAYERELATGAGGQFSHGDVATLADICLVPQVFNAQRFEVDMTKFPLVMAVFERCMRLPAFDDAQPSRQAEAARG